MSRKKINGFWVVVLLSLLWSFPASAGVIETVAGNGISGFSGDGGPATQGSLSYPWGVSVDGLGNLYIADAANNRIRKVDGNGMITTVAGNGINGFSGDGGPATQASLSGPSGVAVDNVGNLYIADYANYRIRKVDGNGIITTVAGNGNNGFSGDGGPATQASLSPVRDVAVDRFGNLYISDTYNDRIRKVDVNGYITTVAGNGTRFFSGDGGPATQASISYPHGVSVDGLGNIYFADVSNSRIRKVDANGIITTVAGNGISGFSGDGGPATQASLYSSLGVTVDGRGNLYIIDSGNQRVRKVDGNGVITTVAGNGTQGFSGDGGSATEARLSWPAYGTVDKLGNLYIGDNSNHRVRRVEIPPSITAVDPPDGAVEVPLGQVITVTFSENIQVVPPESNILLFDEKRLVPVDRTLSVNGNVLTITPLGALIKNATHSVTIPAFAVQDMAGNEMAIDKIFYFTTVRH